MIAEALATFALAASPASAVVDLSPRAVPFGDTVEAHATVAVDPDAVDPDAVVVRLRAGPLTKVGEQRAWTRAGDVAVLRVRARLSCRSAACAPVSGSRSVRLPPLRVGSRSISWPALEILPRVPASAVSADEPPWAVDDAPPPVTYRVEPRSAIAALVGAAAVLAAGGLLLVGIGIRRARRRRPVTTSPLERALARVRASLRGDLAERRRALGGLARTLAAMNRPLARTAGELAWAEPDPAPETAEAFVSRVERDEVTR